MNRLNRRRFLALGAASTASVVLVACGNESPADADLTPTQIPDVAGAPPTLAPITSTPQSGGGGQAGGEQAGGEGGDAGAAPTETVTITALDTMSFDPSEVDVSPGQTLVLENGGFLQHDLAVDDWGGALTSELQNGGTEEFTIPEDAAVGEQFEFYCSIPGHKEAGMTGTFTIVEAGSESAAAGAEETPAEEEASAEEEGAPAAGAAEEGADAGESVVITTLDTMSFDPSEVDVSPGQVITVRNDGFIQHDLAVDDWGGALTPALNNGDTAEVAIPEDAAVGEQFEFYCSIPGHKEAGMTGTFTIVEAGAATAVPAEDGGEEAATAESTPEAEATPVAATADDIVVDGIDPSEAAVQVVATEWRFEPADFEIAPGETIALINRGTVAHGMSAEAFGGVFIKPVGAGHSDSFTIPDDAKVGDTIEYTATNQSAAELGMGGTITIIKGKSAERADATPAASPVASPEASANVAEGGAGRTEVEIVGTDIAFDLTEITIPAGTDVTVILHNEGVLEHDFVIEDTDFATPIVPSGETSDVVVNLPAGEYAFYCSVPGHRQAGMEGTLIVE